MLGKRKQLWLPIDVLMVHTHTHNPFTFLCLLTQLVLLFFYYTLLLKTPVVLCAGCRRDYEWTYYNYVIMWMCFCTNCVVTLVWS